VKARLKYVDIEPALSKIYKEMNTQVKLNARPRTVVKSPAIPINVSVQPKHAVKIPTIHSKPVHVFRVPTKKQPRAVARKSKPTGVRSAIVKPQVVIKKRSLTTVRPSHLRKAHDVILGKHTDKIRALRGSGQGRLLVIIACGPSANEANLDEIKRHPKIDIMCINKPDMRVWPSKYWIFCDQSQHNRNQEYWGSYSGTIINASSVRATHPNQIMIRTLAGKGFSRDITKGFHIGRSTTFASMQVALYMAYNQIYIFGCDMSAVNGQMHRYGQNPDVTNENRAKRFDKEAENYAWALRNMKEYERDKFTFCSDHNPYDFVDKFGRLNQTEAHEHILFKANELLTQKEYELAKI
jgi:hypothetical protein